MKQKEAKIDAKSGLENQKKQLLKTGIRKLINEERAAKYKTTG